MADTISVTSKLPLGFPASDDLTIMPGVTDVDAAKWSAWKATKPGLIDSGDIVETKSDKVPAKDDAPNSDPAPAVTAKVPDTADGAVPAAPVKGSAPPATAATK